MFTGIIEGIGEVKKYSHASSILTIRSALFSKKRPPRGSSIAINGVCLTVGHIDTEVYEEIGFDLGHETKAVSLLGKEEPSGKVNLEFALSAGAPLDGHIVQGHVDGIAELVTLRSMAEERIMHFKCSKELLAFMVPKGSVAINGVSLTINDITEDCFSVCLVPYTVEHTSFKWSRVHDLVHIETDIVGRYLHRFYQRSVEFFF